MNSIGQHSLHDELLGRLRKLIIDGEIAPGAKIPERNLCQLFGVSRTPLREAIKVLAAEGLVRLEPHRGAVVVEPTLEELNECIPITASIEALSGELACEHITDEEIATVKALYDQMLAAHQAGNQEEYFSCKKKIHESILAAARNPLLTSVYDAVYFRIGRMCIAYKLPPEISSRMLADLNEIMEALTARECQRLGMALHKHVEYLLDVYKDILRRAQAKGGRPSPVEDDG